LDAGLVANSFSAQADVALDDVLRANNVVRDTGASYVLSICEHWLREKRGVHEHFDQAPLWSS
jgi:hypothetical protein